MSTNDYEKAEYFNRLLCDKAQQEFNELEEDLKHRASQEEIIESLHEYAIKKEILDKLPWEKIDHYISPQEYEVLYNHYEPLEILYVGLWNDKSISECLSHSIAENIKEHLSGLSKETGEISRLVQEPDLNIFYRRTMTERHMLYKEFCNIPKFEDLIARADEWAIKNEIFTALEPFNNLIRYPEDYGLKSDNLSDLYCCDKPLNIFYQFWKDSAFSDEKLSASLYSSMESTAIHLLQLEDYIQDVDVDNTDMNKGRKK